MIYQRDYSSPLHRSRVAFAVKFAKRLGLPISGTVNPCKYGNIVIFLSSGKPIIISFQPSQKRVLL